MAGVNKVILLGNLGNDPEVRALENGTKVATLSLATSETYTDKDGNRQEQTEWHRIVLWRRTAEVAEKYLKKGSKIFVEGRLKTRSWTDKDNITRYTTEIVGDRMQMLDRREDNGGGNFPPPPSEADAPSKSQSKPANEPVATNTEAANTTAAPEDDLPF